MSNSYFNTTNLSGDNLKTASIKALTQEQAILKFMRKRYATKFTPDELCDKVFNNTVPITSVRRALTNLTCDDIGELIKTETKRAGRYGKLTHTWKVNR